MPQPYEPKNKIVRDAIHGLIWLPGAFREIIDTPEFQRLRFIKQTGLSSYVFPSADHSRFSHSVGTYAVAQKVFAHLRRTQPVIGDVWTHSRLDEDSENEFLLAALCHDIGHTAFSHVLEQDLLPDDMRSHEEVTLALLQNEEGGLGRTIRKHFDTSAVVNILTGKYRIPAFHSLISGELDVDRCDYLLRDCHFMGVSYGHYDLDWLIHSMALARSSTRRLILYMDGARGIEAVRQHAAARRSMYRQIYYHPAIRAAQHLLRAIILRAITVGDSLKGLLPPYLEKIICQNEKPTLDEFVHITDFSVLSMVSRFADEAEDQPLNRLADQFMKRNLPTKVFHACIEETNENDKALKFEDAKYRMSYLQELKEATLPTGLASDQKEILSSQFSFDHIKFSGVTLTDYHFTIEGEVRSADELSGPDFDFSGLGKGFWLVRIFVPRELNGAAKKWVRENPPTMIES